jgi:hypothetical protein
MYHSYSCSHSCSYTGPADSHNTVLTAITQRLLLTLCCSVAPHDAPQALTASFTYTCPGPAAGVPSAAVSPSVAVAAAAAAVASLALLLLRLRGSVRVCQLDCSAPSMSSARGTTNSPTKASGFSESQSQTSTNKWFQGALGFL